MSNLLWLVLGGSVGTLLRYSTYKLTEKYITLNLAWATVIVNMTGSLIIGFLWGFLDFEKLSTPTKNFLFVGILGSFTTFSAFTLDSLKYFKDGNVQQALINIFLQNILGVAFVFIGYLIARQLKAVVV
jgi:CrcB protein